MRDGIKHYPVNWVDGMKINKDHFLQQGYAMENGTYDIGALHLSPIQYGLLPPSAGKEESFDIKVAADNQNTVRVEIHSCEAVTSGGVRISIPSLAAESSTAGLPSTSYTFPAGTTEPNWWIVLTVHPYQKVAAGNPNLQENPPRYPFLIPAFSIQVVSDNQFHQFLHHPYALPIGKLLVTANEIIADQDYIPPCCFINSHPDLLSLHSELDRFLGDLEMKCSQIVQKILKKSQQNELSELVMFLCDRTILYLGQAITQLRWTGKYQAPVFSLSSISTLARIIKNSIDLRIGSGKEEMMNYFSEWSELRPGELEGLITAVAGMQYDQNDINQCIQKVVRFVSVISRLFETLSKLEYIGKKKESGIFVKEESIDADHQNKTRRRFFSS